MDSNAPLAERLEEIARSLRSSKEYKGDDEAWLTPHPDTYNLLNTRKTDREQLNYSVPAALELRERLVAYSVEHGGEGAGNIVAAVLDSWLRSKGYPPPDLKK